MSTTVNEKKSTDWEQVRIPKSILVKKFTSKKSGKPCVALVVDLGYTQKFLTFDFTTVAEVLGVSVADLVSRDDFEICLCSF